MYTSASGFKDISRQLEASQSSTIPNRKHLQRSQKQEDISHEKKKSICDILSNFKKEKEQFNDKLTQLRSRLQAVSSPEQTSKNADEGS
eukprot:CAMPEP_0202970144 /NCGR_PEP_ID=MMETSP1396-20130829/16133_1 /ASSEMBLY_ACC=CAM_ASM_000872 /TAXON_ID= /ORGANISM="Pseudokeronopsis sp., Strain Brazil" /LENGTH=88 /DNA_ID=CAMNT_0049698477 /DNA_START=1335 /DNA_END=1601 /DNA_ORIENTATION=+